MAQDESPVDRIVDLATDYAKKIDEALIALAQASGAEVASDHLSAIIVALLTHANCYVRALQDRGTPATHMDALTRISVVLSDKIYEAYESEYTLGRINVKGPEEPS